MAIGKALRAKVSRRSHAGWKTPKSGRDPIRLLVESSRGREPSLIPIRYGRMLQSPFTFYRGAAAIMAADLARTPTSGIRVQACGDCHLLNFGAFATPERRVIFDINDFDETLPAPFEWDVKRLAASFVVASRANGYKSSDAHDAAQVCAEVYRQRMAEYATMKVLDVWYGRIDLETLMGILSAAERRRTLRRRLEKAKARDVAEEDFPKLAELHGREAKIKDNPPLIYHFAEAATAEFERRIAKAFELYRRTLAEDRRFLLDRYELKDVAMKVVGVGSVGTVSAILLLMAADDDPLFLQVKEARTSVLEPYAGKSAFASRGERVVVGQRLMQSASDLFLGWTETDVGRHFYVRQLRDMKLKPLVELWDTSQMIEYAGFCGWALARAHARSGDAAAISGYLGGRGAFDEAVADFAVDYADQNERDHKALVAAVKAGRMEVHLER